MGALRSGALYFAAVFAAGCVLGAIRVLWAVPRFGPRVAELMETPLMLAALILAARTIVRRLAIPPSPAPRLAMGGIALALLPVAELALVLRLRGLSVAEYVAGRDPVSGSIYAGCWASSR